MLTVMVNWGRSKTDLDDRLDFGDLYVIGTYYFFIFYVLESRLRTDPYRNYEQ